VTASVLYDAFMIHTTEATGGQAAWLQESHRLPPRGGGGGGAFPIHSRVVGDRHHWASVGEGP
jgi:hypothetical protein